MAEPEPMDIGTGDIVVDDGTGDQDSALGIDSWDNDDTKSLSSSVLKYTWENGRRYHAYKDGSYWYGFRDASRTGLTVIRGPNDERQLDTEDFIEFAQKHESAEVIGVDLSPVQPSMVPINVKFEVDDVNMDWTYPKNHFDFVHIRMLTGSINDWPTFHRKIYDHLAPGGWVEQVELSVKTKSDDGTVTPDMPFAKWEQVFAIAGEQTGKSFMACEIAAEAIRQAGFEKVHEVKLKIPIGRWPKNEALKVWGTWCRAFLIDGTEGFGLRMMTGVLGWTYEETQAFMADMKRHLMDPKIHGYVEMVVAYGRKPTH
ncbi:hypothetical protein FDECE_2756 [Fusarium decemcellulare]|nr:hypothetical protein FDECE_2756 [Fusarium decemcellulare]